MPDAVLRFAPSPTGGFHVGNARTALFNYLYARHYGGRLLLRVEDTDRKRFTEESLQTILEGLRWLGIDFDGDPVYQSHNLEAHRRAAEQLSDSGHAYVCYCSSEELEAKRKQALERKASLKYDGTCRELTADQRATMEAEGRAGVIRFRVPEGETVWNDAIHGVQRWDNGEIGDFVVLRADGSPVYLLAVVVDDHEMGVTLALRGADHLSNTPKQILLFQALGWEVPQYAHNTLTLGPDGRKLSKRHGATTVTEYREKGYLSDAVFNFLALLGWAPGDGREVFTREELVEAFTIEGMLKKDAVFDEQKLEWLNGEHIRQKPLEDLVPEALAAWTDEGWLEAGKAEDGTLSRLVALVQERVRTVRDFRAFGYFFRDPEQYEEKARKKHWQADTPARIETLTTRLESLDFFTESKVEEVTRTLAGELGVSTGKLIHPTRLAVSGVGFGPGLFELMEVLGQETCSRRLRKALESL
ncbi:MAG: glutamate--tRNA ligase [Candidatus Latescibacteria bacterium]|nr:glutamate--tRNA ligase [Candidatus Latescibacterota bacterium]